MKHIFIVNEGAGRGKYKKILPNIEEACKKRRIKYEIKRKERQSSFFFISHYGMMW